MILLYFYYTRYKPPSFDLRLTALVNSFISLCVALIGTVTQTIGVYRYQKLFKMGPSKILIFISVLPVILVTPLMKVKNKDLKKFINQIFFRFQFYFQQFSLKW